MSAFGAERGQVRTVRGLNSDKVQQQRSDLSMRLLALAVRSASLLVGYGQNGSEPIKISGLA